MSELDKCAVCGNECSGVCCSGACRAKLQRTRTVNERTVEVAHAQRTVKLSNPEVLERVVTRTNPDALNYGKPMSMHELKQAGLKANRVPIPGDADYTGCCEQVDGKWRVRA